MTRLLNGQWGPCLVRVLRSHALFAVVALIAAASTAVAQVESGLQSTARVQVEYLHSERYSDLRDQYVASPSAREAYLKELREHIQRRALRYVHEGQSLYIGISEIDMAGGFEPWRRDLGNVRIVRELYPPRIDLAFKWTAADGAVLKEGDRTLRDPSFLARTNRYGSDPLKYEKLLLDDWLESEFRPPA